MTLTSRTWTGLLAAVGLAGLTTLGVGVGSAAAAEAPIGFGTARSFGVLAGSTVTNTGPSVINGDVGVSPGTAVTGFPPGTVNGTTSAADAVAKQAQADAATAYADAGSRASTATVASELGGRTFLPGVYTGPALMITGTLTLDAKGNPAAVFIFRASSTLTTATDSKVRLINGARACNVVFRVASSATLGVRTALSGTVLAATAITAKTRATVVGRLLAQTAAVTLDTNTISTPDCSAVSASTSPSASTGGSPTASATPSSGAGSTSSPRPSAATTSATPAVPARASTTPAARAVTGVRGDGTGGLGANADTETQLPLTGSRADHLLLGGSLSLLVGALLLAAAGRPAVRGKHAQP